jgi:hypothetical protein
MDNRKAYNCKICNKSYVTELNYLKHMQSVHKILPESKENNNVENNNVENNNVEKELNELKLKMNQLETKLFQLEKYIENSIIVNYQYTGTVAPLLKLLTRHATI